MRIAVSEPVCKVGGEIEASSFTAILINSTMVFLGHSYLGAWVNCGAGTVTSDLKNNYSTVKVYVNGETGGQQNAICGLSRLATIPKTANQFHIQIPERDRSFHPMCLGPVFRPKYVPSFSWGAAGETFTTYKY